MMYLAKACIQSNLNATDDLSTISSRALIPPWVLFPPHWSLNAEQRLLGHRRAPGSIGGVVIDTVCPAHEFWSGTRLRQTQTHVLPRVWSRVWTAASPTASPALVFSV